MFDRITRTFRTFGLPAGAIYGLNRVLQRLSPALSVKLHDWMVQPITNRPILPGRLGAAYTARFIEDDEALVAAMPIRPEVRAARRRQGTRCLAAFRRDELVGYIWLAFERYEEDEARCTFHLSPPEQSVFDFDLYVLPAHRGSLAFAAVWHLTSQLLYERGVRYSYSRLDHFNRASARAHDHFGWRRVGRALIVRLWGLEILFATRPPYVFVSWRDDRRASYTLTPEVLEGDAGRAQSVGGKKRSGC